ncbi:hypothetical protein [Aliikangiella coralliicola]|uniref:Uncharacterized protein n=1 Tax=Aliikangiella coralliicola TaxID=2592383 RepID=A0A545UB37_9GAMM|nr:hypothetical protein [Aliikangiella coralliicola]TQV86686.1 hypothetical protein FLL46_17485 [Aliikangiella coralliicola]
MKRLFLILVFFISGIFSVYANSSALPSGGSVSGILLSNSQHVYSFSANNGDSVNLSANSLMQTHLTIYNPDGSVLGSGYNSYYRLGLPQSGNYQVKIKPRYSGQHGSYELHYVNASTANEHGSLTSGGVHLESFTPQDLDSYTFEAESGDAINLSVNSSKQTTMAVYYPDGSRVGYGYNSFYQLNLAQTGTYRVVISSRYAFNTDDYELHFVNSATANEHGVLTSGGVHLESFTPQDLDSYTFEADSGDAINLSVNSSKQTTMAVYYPDGSRVGYGYNSFYQLNLAQTGTYRVVISSRYAFNTDDYELHFVNSATANEHGVLTSGGVHLESFTPQDLDSYTFEADSGDAINLSVNSSKQTTMAVYYPDGSRVGYGYNSFYQLNLAQTGTYRVVISSRYAFNTDDYELHFVNSATANEHGVLTSGGVHLGSFTPQDLDSYTFEADSGDAINLSVNSSKQTTMAVYYPDGSRVGYGYNSFYQLNLAQTGTYRVVISSRYAFNTDDYELHFVNSATANEHGKLVSGETRSGSFTPQDLDSYTFDVISGANIQIATTSSNQTTMAVYYPDGSRVGYGYNSYYRANLPQTGTYRLVIGSRYAFNTDDYTIGLTVSYNNPSAGLSLSSTGLNAESDPVMEFCDAQETVEPFSSADNELEFSSEQTVFSETDYADGILKLSRIYRPANTGTEAGKIKDTLTLSNLKQSNQTRESMAKSRPINGFFGADWTSNYERTLTFLSPAQIQISSGREVIANFIKSGEGWAPETTSDFVLIEEIKNESSLAGYRVIRDDGTRENFDLSGKLLSIEYSAGELVKLSYDNSNRLISVIDDNNRALNFNYDASARVASVSTPDGLFLYAYDSNDNLISVSLPADESRIYHYENLGNPNLMTGITDEQGVYFVIKGKGSKDRVMSSGLMRAVDSCSAINFSN